MSEIETRLAERYPVFSDDEIEAVSKLPFHTAQKVYEMAVAIRPFAALADMVGEAWPDDMIALTGTGVTIKIGDLRQARKATGK